MPSFTKRAPASASAQPVGTVPSLSSCIPPLYLLPTGIPSLDDILGGGGLPLGGVWCILTPDRYTSWSKIVERYWIARGLVDGQKGVMVGEKGEEIVRGCMWIDEAARQSTPSLANGSSGDMTAWQAGGDGKSTKSAAGSESEGEDAGLKVDVSALGENRPKIAWRYDGMQKFQTTLGKGHHGELNLLKTIPPATIASLERQKMQQYIPLESSASTSSSSTAWSIMSNVLTRLQTMIQKHDDSQVLRVTIHNLGDVFWGSPTSSEVMRFLHALRSLVRDRSVGVLITLPPDLARSPPEAKGKGRASQETEGDDAGEARAWVKKLSWAVDACIELKGFGDDPSLPPLFHPLHGLLTVHSLPTTHHILPPSYKHSSLLGLSTSSSTSGRGGGAGENNLGFRLGRKRLVVETVHLGIEGGQGERRTEPAPEVGGMVSGVEKPPRPVDVGTGEVDMAVSKTQDGTGIADSKYGDGAAQPTLKKKSKGVRFTEAEDDPGGGPSARVMVRHDKMELYEF